MERYKGDRNPSFYTTITIDGIPVDLSSATGKFYMRPETSSTFKVNGTAATIVTASSTLNGDHVLPDSSLALAATTGFLDAGCVTIGGNYFFYTGRTSTHLTGVTTEQTGLLATGAAVAQVGGLRYDPSSADVDMADVGAVERANYVAFFEVTITGKTQKTPPFDITFVDMAFASVDLCTLQDVRQAMEAADITRFRDELIRELIPTASRMVMDECEREFAPATAAATRRFRVDPSSWITGGYYVPLTPYDLRTVSSVTLHPDEVSPTTLAATDYVLNPQNGAGEGTYWTLLLRGSIPLSSGSVTDFGFAYLDIAGAWGCATVPGKAKEATVRTVRAWLRREAPAFIADVEEPRTFAGLVPGMFGLPPDARRLLASLKRPHGVA